MSSASPLGDISESDNGGEFDLPKFKVPKEKTILEKDELSPSYGSDASEYESSEDKEKQI